MSAIPLPHPLLASTKPMPAASALGALRSQAAFLRALLDEVERLTFLSSVDESLSEQIVEELTRLGCRSLEAADELSRVVGKLDHGRCA